MKENDIRPKFLYDTYLNLLLEDSIIFFDRKIDWKTIECPSCSGDSEEIFTKNDFPYRECLSCKTIFLSPRPPVELFYKFYTESNSSKYWADVFYPAVEKIRINSVVKPKIARVLTVINELENQESLMDKRKFINVIDIGSGNGSFLDLIPNQFNKLGIEPNLTAANISINKGHKILTKMTEDVTLEEISKGRNFLTCFELFEHVHDPKNWLRTIYDFMRLDDVLFLTTLNGSGLDIRVLWDKSKAIAPPIHINFFNPKSIRNLAQLIGFQVYSITTPGLLDIDILKNNYVNVNDQFWRLILKSESDSRIMQDFIAQSNFSSHMQIVLIKK